MKIICAGYNRTGTKSCSRALEILGYKVADLYETAEYLRFVKKWFLKVYFSLSDVWLDFLNGKVKIEKVISEYKIHGFDVNQDLPGNIHWKDLYKASPQGTKVILTVRDSGKVLTYHFVLDSLTESPSGLQSVRTRFELKIRAVTNDKN